ncbi:MAG: DNA (cytosine-5-)-methyltransferase [Bacteroidetes bacterium]|nr:MAG: DNA (cytosine-5-)-methyltransferase [Bacteroidota bacterium]
MRVGVNTLIPDSHRFANHKPPTIAKFQFILDNGTKNKIISKRLKKELGTNKHTVIPLDENGLSPTLTTLPDDYIHYCEPRILTVREYCRIQSFPDWYLIKGKYTPSTEAHNLLPYMNTDISLTSSTHKIIIDTKYYQEVLKTHYEKQHINPSNLYQIYSYVRNSQDGDKKDLKIEGILLYPTVSKQLDYTYPFGGYKISVKTINLNQSCERIRADLLAMIDL